MKYRMKLNQYGHGTAQRLVAAAAFSAGLVLAAPTSQAADLYAGYGTPVAAQPHVAAPVSKRHHGHGHHGLFGLHLLFGHDDVNPHYKSDRHIIAPRRYSAPAYAAPYRMPTATFYAPHERYVDRGSVVSHSGMSFGAARRTSAAVGYAPSPLLTAQPPAYHHGYKAHHGNRGYHGKKRHYGGGYAKVVGVNRITVRCRGYGDGPESQECYEVDRVFVPNAHGRKSYGHQKGLFGHH